MVVSKSFLVSFNDSSRAKHRFFNSAFFLFLFCTTEWAVLGQNLCFSKNFSEGQLPFVRYVAKLAKVKVTRKRNTKGVYATDYR